MSDIIIEQPLHCNITIPTTQNDEQKQKILEVIVELNENWKNFSLNISNFIDKIYYNLFGGGITNQLYKVEYNGEEDISLDPILVRIYGDKTELLIDREEENLLFLWLSKNKFSPKLYGTFNNGRVEGYLYSRPLTAEEMSSSEPIDFQRMIAKELSKMHLLNYPRMRNNNELINEFSVKQKILNWYHLSLECDFTNDSNQLEKYNQLNLNIMGDEVIEVCDRLYELLNEIDINTWDNIEFNYNNENEIKDIIKKMAIKFATTKTLTHNDLLCGNVLINEEWFNTEKECYLIDYEYASYEIRVCDIANHFNEYCGYDFILDKYPNQITQIHFLKEYTESYLNLLTESNAFHNKLKELLLNNDNNIEYINYFYQQFSDLVNKFAVIPNLYWGFWSVIQAKNSKIDFDFFNFAKVHFDGYFHFKNYL